MALLDYDNDGWLDIYMVNGSTYDAITGKTTPPHAALFHNNHDGTFTNVAEQAGVTNDRWGFGAVVGDFDNDGWPDIYVSNFGGNRLYHNNHDGTFTDVAKKAGLTLGNWSTGATFGDYDGDGKLDLFVPGYVHWDWNHLPPALDPDDVAAHYNLAILYNRMGMRKQAAQQAALFATKKVDPGAPTYALDYLKAHPEISTESVPWHMHTNLLENGSSGQSAQDATPQPENTQGARAQTKPGSPSSSAKPQHPHPGIPTGGTRSAYPASTPNNNE